MNLEIRTVLALIFIVFIVNLCTLYNETPFSVVIIG